MPGPSGPLRRRPSALVAGLVGVLGLVGLLATAGVGAASGTAHASGQAGSQVSGHASSHASGRADGRVNGGRGAHDVVAHGLTYREQMAGPDPDATAYADPRGPRGAGRPNIILVLTDDMALRDLKWMPYTRKLIGGQGVDFRHDLSPHPLCCPARAAILTGQYAQNNGVKSNEPPYDYAALHAGTALPVWLHRAGYRTGFTGKYLNGFGIDGPRQPGWDYWDPSKIGDYAYTPYRMEQNGHPQYYPHLNNVDYINHRVDDLIDRWAGKKKPFFIWASHIAPHGRVTDRPGGGHQSSAYAVPPTRFDHVLSGVRSPSLSDPGYAETDLSDQDPFLASQPVVDPARVEGVFLSRIRALQGVDEGVRRMVATLRAKHVLDNTYIFFTSDNGFLLGEHHLLTKNVPYWQALRVPLLVRGPGIPHGAVRTQQSEMIDLAPTFAAIANAKPAVRVDGVSLLPTMKRNTPLRQTVLIQAGPSKRTNSGPVGWWWRGVTTGRYTYAHFFADDFDVLYDHDSDPSEIQSVADDPRYADILSELKRRLAILETCSGAPQCSASFGPLPEPAKADTAATVPLLGGVSAK